MNDKLTNYLNAAFAPYDGVKSVAELKAELHADLQERYHELKASGNDDDTAFEMTINSIGDIEQTVQEVANLSRSLERQVLTNFNAANLAESDFAGVTAHKGTFKWSALSGSNFAVADLTGSTFTGSDVRQANFDGANLTDCTFTTLDLSGASFKKAILARTEFNKSDLSGAHFTDVQLMDVKMTMSDLKATTFENCTFDGVDFSYSDLQGQRFDGLTFTGVKFDKAALSGATFNGATLRNVSFRPSFALTNRYFRAIKSINFDGARMDKLTFASLKGMGAELSKVEVI